MPLPHHPITGSPLADRVRALLQGLRPSEHTAVLGMAMAVGLLGGFGNILYRRMIELVHRVVFEGGGELLNLDRGWPWLLLVPLLPMAGAVLLIPLAALFPGEVCGYGLPKFLEAVNLKGAVFRARTVVVKSVASAITIGSGGSAGTEGPIAQIGGAIGSLVGQALNVGQERLRTLVACGVAAGIGGTFNAPIAGVFFAHELVLCRSFVATSFVPVVISSGLGAMVTRAVEGNRPAFQVPHYLLRTPWEALLYVPLGVIVGLAAVHFIRSFYGITDRFQAWDSPGWLKPVVGAGLAGTLGIAFPQVLGDGYHHVELALAGQFTGWALVLVALTKMYATGFTLGSGNAGGVFAPSLVVGAMLGGAYGWAMDLLFPSFAAGPGSYALVGMGGFLAAATHAPMTAIFLIFEMTGEYTVIVPIMFACVIGYSVSRWLQPHSIDHLELARRGIHLEEGRETNVLKSIRVESLMNRQVESFPESTPLGVMLRAIPSSRHVTFPLVDEAGKLSGIISLQDFREVAYEEGLADLVVASELGTREVITVFPDDTVHDALARIGYRNIEHLPVVSREDPREILGMLSRRDILSAYNKALIDRSLRAPEG